jgi:hypothetical protein
MPHSNIRWGTPEEFDPMGCYDGESGAIVEVTLEYPSDLHDKHQVPLAPETVYVTWAMLSPVTKARLGEKAVIRRTPQKRLLAHFGPRVRYVLDARRLQYLLSRGLKLTAVHRVILFTQRAWVKPYVEFNNARRTEAKRRGDEAGVAAAKLSNVSISGKTMQNNRDRTNSELTTDKKRVKALIRKRVVKNIIDMGGGKAIVISKKESCTLDVPMLVAVCLLDMAKTSLDKADERLVNAFAERKGKVQKLYTDTDSLVYLISHPEPERVMRENLSELFDFSNMPKSHPLFSTANENKLGCLKYEMAGYVMDYWVCPQLKCYKAHGIVDPRCAKEVQQKEMSIMKTKGVPNRASSKQMSMGDFTDPLRRPKTVEYTKIRSTCARLFNETNRRTVLNFTDGKQYWFEDGTSLPFGHYRVPNEATPERMEELGKALEDEFLDKDDSESEDFEAHSD